MRSKLLIKEPSNKEHKRNKQGKKEEYRGNISSF